MEFKKKIQKVSYKNTSIKKSIVMKTLDRIQQKLLGQTKKQLQLANPPRRFYYNDEFMFYRNKSTAY